MGYYMLELMRKYTRHGLGEIFRQVALMDVAKDSRINFLIKTTS